MHFIPTAMKELKRSAYKDVFAAVLGSRDQLCIHPDLKGLSNSDKTLKCKQLRKCENCKFHTNLTKRETIKDEPEFIEDIMDIEDILRAGVKHKCCPYYLAKARAELAKVIFMPYNVSGECLHNFSLQFN